MFEPQTADASELQKFDVFFSYAWAKDSGDETFRKWSLKIADSIATMLSQRYNSRTPHFRFFLDRNEERYGSDINTVLESCVRQSSIFIAMISDYYDSDYCLNELRWFREKLEEAKLNADDHLCILRLQKSQDDWWPAQLKGVSGEPLHYLDFSDPAGQPLGMAQFLFGAPMKGLVEPIDKAVLDIGRKLDVIRRNNAAKEAYRAHQEPPEYPVVFFETEEGDVARWHVRRPDLEKEMPSIIVPRAVPATAATIEELENCDGIVMLRSQGSTQIGLRIMRAYQLRRQLESSSAAASRKGDNLLLRTQPKLPWVLLDELETPPPEGESFRVPRVSISPGWAKEVKQKLWG